MATKTIKTRIKNRIDSLANWSAAGVELLPGEIALVRVDTQQLDESTGNIVSIPAVLLKVGEADENGNPKAFSALPWLSAKASDVYDWAKGEKAEDINIKVILSGSSTATEKTLSDWLKTNTDSANDMLATAAANAAAIGKLSASDTTKGSIAYQIKAALETLNGTMSGTGGFVRAVTQTNGNVVVVKGDIQEADIPSISASKVIIDTDSTTLATKLETVDSDISNLKNKTADTEINKLIDNKINTLDVSDSGTGFVTAVTQTDGKISVTKGALPIDVENGVASYSSVDALTKTVNGHSTDIADLKSAVVGGTHFLGEVTAAPTDSSVTINGETKTVRAGDIVICGEKEYIYVGNTWKELGDLSRVGAVETAITAMDCTETNAVASTNKFVSQVTQTDGKISVTYTQPTSANVSHDSSTVKAVLEDHSSKIVAAETKLDGITKVSTAISDAISALDCDEPTASGTSTSFIATASQTDGKLTVTKKNLPTASTAIQGIVKLNDTTSSTSTTEAATANVVKKVSDDVADAKTRMANVETDYVRFSDDRLYVGKDGMDVIIFDCGGAEIESQAVS